MIKAMMLGTLLSGGGIRPRDNPKIKNTAIALGVVVAANLLVYSPIIMANIKQEE
jgi:hypothetical protein